MHATHFEMANKIKVTYIVQSYLWAVHGLNAVAVYSAARSLLELHAILRYVEVELMRAASGAAEEWRDRGCRYFQLLIQARFGTSDPEKQKLLRDAGVPEAAHQPIRTGKARKALSSESPWVDSHYAMLCDYVHHNLSSLSIAGGFAGRANIACSSGGGRLLLKGEGSLIQYGFPMPEAGKQAIQKTAERAALSMRGIVSAIDGFPRTPYSEEELKARTGSTLGLKELPPEVPRVGFLSHSFKDALIILGIKRIMESMNLTVYVDWIEDPGLDRDNVTAETAAVLRVRMKACGSLVYAHSTNSKNSAWMPWELGFDGFKGNYVWILPVTEQYDSEFKGQEYLGLYPKVSLVDVAHHLPRLGIASVGTPGRDMTLNEAINSSGVYLTVAAG